jgi:hypothetical protein
MTDTTAERLKRIMAEVSAKESELAPFVDAGLIFIGEGHLGYDLTDKGRALLESEGSEK